MCDMGKRGEKILQFQAVSKFTLLCMLISLPPPLCSSNFVQGTLAARRQAAAVVRGDEQIQKLFGEMAERYSERNGGYTRVLRTRRRPNDAAQMAFIEYIDREGELRPARPVGNSLLPKAAQVLQQQVESKE